MSQSLWEPEEMAQLPAEPVAQPLQEQTGEQFQPQSEIAAEAQPVVVAQPEAVALTADEFSALEERILRAVDLVKRERTARTAAEERAAEVEAKLSGQAGAVEELQKEVDGLRAERDHVRQRVERLLSELDALEL
jgi:uncharacterized coiled-coil protein SlyX